MRGRRDEILDIAERFIRQQGYNGFSFRDVAEAASIKSASVHYHFPGKGDLGAAVARRYSDRFMEALGDPEAHVPDEQIRRYVNVFRVALIDEGMVCLCCMLGAETLSLPVSVLQESKVFFQKNIDWLETVLNKQDADGNNYVRALGLLSALEGAMIVARSLEDHEILSRVADQMVAQYTT